jgi:hypothetical protein
MLFSKKKVSSVHIFLILSVGIGLLPALISNDAPHSNRAHGIVPFIQLLAAYGLYQIYIFVRYVTRLHNVFILKMLVLCAGLLFFIETGLHVRQYTRIYQSLPAITDFQYGFLQAAIKAKAYVSQVDKVVMTDTFGQPYIYVLFAKGLTPIQWQQGAMANYEFKHISWEEQSRRSRILVIGTPEEIPADVVTVDEIQTPQHETVLKFVILPEKTENE